MPLNLSNRETDALVMRTAVQSGYNPFLALSVHHNEPQSDTLDPAKGSEERTREFGRILHEVNGNIPHALWAYHAGTRELSAGRLPWETARYIPRVLQGVQGVKYRPSRRALGDYSAIAQAIQTQEGYYPGSLSYRLNNPGNLVYAGQPGATPVTVGTYTFASFPSYDAGYQALLNQISLDASRGLTIQQFATKYAPAAAGNDPTTYAANLAAAVGLSPTDPLSDASGFTGTISDGSVSSTDASVITIAGVDIPTTYVLAGGIGILALVFFSMR